MEEQIQQQTTTQPQQVEPKVEVKEETKQTNTEEISPKDPTDGLIMERINGSIPSFGVPVLPTIKPQVLPMGTVTQKITIPASILPDFISKNPSNPKQTIKINPDQTASIEQTICDGEVVIGPVKSCLKEFTGIPAVGWVFAAAGLIVLWKWLDWKFKK